MSLFIDIHVLQTVPPSNLNRDDTGSPKSAVYGGVRRSRVSSQAWKKAARTAMKNDLDASDLGFRTKRALRLVVEEMRRREPDIDEATAAAAASDVLKTAGLKLSPVTKPKTAPPEEAAPLDQTNYLVFLSRHQIEQVAQLALADGRPSKKAAQLAVDSAHGVEVSLFGRMVADDKSLSVDASVQVAHALSTHAVDDEGDYFTAVDDCSQDDESGAGMLGTIEFNSSTLYRYATVNVEGLRHNLNNDDAVLTAVTTFVRAFVSSMPTGKQNTFANRTVPDGVVLFVRHDQPVNLVGAYEDAVTAQESQGRIRESAARLVQQTEGVTSFVDPADLTLVITSTSKADTLATLGDSQSLNAALTMLEAHVRGALQA